MSFFQVSKESHDGEKFIIEQLGLIIANTVELAAAKLDLTIVSKNKDYDVTVWARARSQSNFVYILDGMEEISSVE